MVVVTLVTLLFFLRICPFYGNSKKRKCIYMFMVQGSYDPFFFLASSEMLLIQAGDMDRHTGMVQGSHNTLVVTCL